MSKKVLHIFVEGIDDEKFIKAFIRDKKCFEGQYKKIKCIKYSSTNASKIKSYIDVITKAGDDYLFLADADFSGKVSCFPERKRKILETYQLEDINRVWIVIYEIESWFLSGFDKNFCKKENLKFIQNTEPVTKEKFDKEIDTNEKKKTHNQLIDFLVKNKNSFSFKEVANNRNKSLIRFYNHFNLNCIDK